MTATHEHMHRLIERTLRSAPPQGVRRRDIRVRVRQMLEDGGHLQAHDSNPSAASDGKPFGEALIDWRITRLRELGRIESLRRGFWRLP